MAGIGLALQKLAEPRTYLHGSIAYISSGIISAGPWLISVLSLALLQGAIGTSLPADGRMLLFATITYAFVASSVLTGPIQIVLTRILADHLFLDEVGAIAGTFSRTLTRTVLFLAVVLAPFLALAPFPPAYRMLAGSLFLAVSMIWLALCVLTAARDYRSIVFAFALGYAISGGAALGLGKHLGVMGALLGFTLGQVVCLGLLLERVFLEFPASRAKPAPTGRPWRKYASLGLVGLLYHLGLWSEKILYWLSPSALRVAGFFRTFPPYDTAILVAYLLTIPASAVLLVNLETDFYRHYRAFYRHILRKGCRGGGRPSRGTFQEITEAKEGMVRAARSGLVTLLKVQGMVAGFSFLLAPDLARWIGLPPQHLATMRLAILAASGQVFVLYTVLLLLYVDARRKSLLLAFVFALSNLGLSWLALQHAQGAYGLGYLLSTIATTLAGTYLLNSVLTRLDYLTFMDQPLDRGPRKRSRPHSPAARGAPSHDRVEQVAA
ncbi:MAG TPA: exopolysaccharide Pel transporter PelG [Anaerolineales bacterium]